MRRPSALLLLAGLALLPLGCAEMSDVMNNNPMLMSQLGAVSGVGGPLTDVAIAGAKATPRELTPHDQYLLGCKVSSRLLAGHTLLPPGDARSQYVARVGRQLALASQAPYQFDGYHFLVLDTPEINAFAAPGGFILVTTGMLGFLQNEDELAAILGHEVGHIDLEHGIKAVGRERMMKFTSVLGDAAASEAGVGGVPMMDQALDEMTDAMMGQIRQGYSVEIESAADCRGIELTQALGYDAGSLARVLARFKQSKGSYGGANYPAEREADAQSYLARVAPGGPWPTLADRTARFKATVAAAH